MTRFARARGSKACNERQEEEATPWCIMRQQLTSQLAHTQFPEPPQTLEKLTKPANTNSLQGTEDWSEFDEPLHKQAITKKAMHKQIKVNKIKTKKLNKTFKEPSIEANKELERLIDPACRNELSFQNGLINNKNKSELAIKSEPFNKFLKKAKQIRKTKICPISTTKTTTTDIISDNEDVITKELTDFSKIKKAKKKPVDIQNSVLDTTLKESQMTHDRKTASKNITSNWYKNESHTIIANGREIQIVRYDGFFVKKYDAIELKKLRKKLKAQNISSDKIKMVLKLERRKAEKALAREKSSVCFQCRQFGHNFADCPEIKDCDVSKSGMCFKCGSMEHTHFKCKILQNENFRFAVCFVCKEQGHIARQCSANPKGQYPKGGSCHLCGEITHLRKNCPRAVVEKPTSSLTLVTHSKNGGLEEISDGNVVKKSNAHEKKPKVVKF